MKLIFLDFDRTIIKGDTIDLMKDYFIKIQECRKLWNKYENEWIKGEIDNHTCLIHQFNLYDLKSKEYIKEFLEKEDIQIRNNIYELINRNLNNLYKIQFFIITDNFQFIVEEVFNELKENIAFLKKECNSLKKEDIKNFLDNNQAKIIKVFSNFLTIKNKRDDKYIRPIIIRELSKKEIKNIVVEYYKNLGINIEKTIFIGANKTEEDIELANDCDEKYIFERSELALYFSNNGISFTKITYDTNLTELIK